MEWALPEEVPAAALRVQPVRGPGKMRLAAG